MAVLSKVVPTIATRIALKLFFTPLKFPTPTREYDMRKSAKRHLLSTDTSDFTLFEWGNSGPKVLLVHGWSGRATQFFKMAEVLVEQGYHVFAVEAPAHGDSPQKKTHMLEFVDCIEVAQQKFGNFNLAIGHSLGGMAIFNAFKRNLNAAKVVVIGTPSNIRNVVHDFCEKVRANKEVANGIISTIEKSYALKVEDASTDTLAAEFQPKGLIIHDEQDQDIGLDNAQELAEKWTQAKLLVTKGLGHRKVLMDQKVMEEILHFLSAE